MDVKEYLKEKGIRFQTFTHPPVYTCEEAAKYNSNIRGIHSKNLFVKNKKSKKFYLVILPATKRLDRENLGVALNDKLKFANENDLKEILGLSTGAVSPFGIINDEERKVQVVIDKAVWESDFVSFHPNVNTETLELSKADFHLYINSLGNKLVII
ncbi:prolyl-tRNA synthetase associated domain-containing protein [Candidatus Woesearchaeota archaeon]|nr:prolyl-tRNA synthetase associated domain-containing protein [Candidatus Woesearchaeota archaeon]